MSGRFVDIPTMAPTVHARELERLRAMTPTEKLRVSAALWREARTITRAAVAQRNPTWQPDQIERETRRIMSGGRA